MRKIDAAYLLIRDEVEEKLPIERIAVWFVVSRLFVFAIAGLAIHFIPSGRFGANGQPINWLNHWDAHWYLDVARNGYGFNPYFQSSAAFLPLYPLLVRLLGHAIGFRFAGYLISNAFLFFSCLLLWKLAQRDYRGVADRAVLFLLFNPAMVFFSSIYTESLFLFLALATAWLAVDRRWTSAGACGALAALTRSVGLLLAVLIATELLQRWRKKDLPTGRLELFRAFVGIALPPAGLAFFVLFLFWKFNDPLAFFHAEAQWHRQLVPPWNVIWAAWNYNAFDMVWLYAALIAGLVLAVLTFSFRLRASFVAFTAACMLLYCSTNLLEAFPRFLSVVFPFYFVAAEMCRRWPRLEPVFLGLSGAFGAFGVVLFADGYWFT